MRVAVEAEGRPGWSHDEQTLETAAQYVETAADLIVLRAVSPRMRRAVERIAAARYPRHVRLAAAWDDSSPSWVALRQCARGTDRALGELHIREPCPSREALRRCATRGAAYALAELSRVLWEARCPAARAAAQVALRDAARADDSETIEDLVDKGVHLELALDVEHPMPRVQAMPMLHAAAMDGRAQALGALLASGADALRTHSDGSLPTNLAAQYGRRACVALLLREAPLCLNARDGFGSTPLHAAVLMGERAIVEDLLSLEADTHVQGNSGLNALELAQRRERRRQKLGQATAEDAALVALIARHHERGIS